MRRALLLAAATALLVAGPVPAQATERFRVSLTGTWKTQAHATDTTCYRLANPESTDMIPFTGEFDGVETASFSTLRSGTALARVQRGRLDVVGTGAPLRLRVPLDRRSTAGAECKPGDGERNPDCGKRDLRLGVGVFNRGTALTFGWVKLTEDPLGGSGYSYYTPSDPYDRCQLVELQDGLLRLREEIGEGTDFGIAKVSRKALMDRRRKTLVLRGSAEGHPRKDTRDAEGQGEVITVDYRLDWTLTLRRVRRQRG